MSVALVGLASGMAPAAAQQLPPPPGHLAWIEDRARIHVAHADGSDDTVIFGLTPDATGGIQGVAWRPDGGQLAFSSGHEALCSVWVADLHLMDPDGTDLRRLTNGPACAELAGLPTGSVRVTLSNPSVQAEELLVHVQGLEAAQLVILPAGTQGTFELSGVHDLGDDVPQFVVVGYGSTRWFEPSAFADVRAGEVADAGVIDLGAEGYDTWGALSASWSPTGDRIAYQQGLGSLWQIDAGAGQLEVGRPLFEPAANASIAATSPAWSPVDDRVLYQRYDASPSTIDLGTVGSADVGSPIVPVTLAHGIDWLPGGDGFVYSDSSGLLDRANLFLADLRTGAVTQVTGYETGFALWPTVSPDGAWVAYGYSAVPLDEAQSVELRIRHLETGFDQLVVPNGLNPDWGP